MPDRPLWVAAAGPALLGGLVFGAAFFGLSLKCTGELEPILGDATGRQALVPMLRHGLTHPIGLLTYALPIFLGIWTLLLATPRLRHRPALTVALSLFPFPALIVLAYVMAPRVCDPGPGALTLTLLAGGFFAALAALIVRITGARA